MCKIDPHVLTGAWNALPCRGMEWNGEACTSAKKEPKAFMHCRAISMSRRVALRFSRRMAPWNGVRQRALFDVSTSREILASAWKIYEGAPGKWNERHHQLLPLSVLFSFSSYIARFAKASCLPLMSFVLRLARQRARDADDSLNY